MIIVQKIEFNVYLFVLREREREREELSELESGRGIFVLFRVMMCLYMCFIKRLLSFF